MSIYHAGIDLSLRSTGISILDDNQRIVDCTLVCNPDQDEEVLIKNSVDIISFLNWYQPKFINLEGLSFGSLSSSKDILAGNFWYLRVALKQNFPDSNIKIVAVSSWRKYVLTKEFVRELKKQDLPKGWQKTECLKKLPEDVREKFEKYIHDNKLPKKSIFDLTDSYWIATFSFR